MPNADQRVALRRGQAMVVEGTKVRKTFWTGKIEVTSPPDEFKPTPQKHTVQKGASFGMNVFQNIDGQQVAHTIIFT